MESTGIYWIPVFEILESKGFEVKLVNSRHVKNVPGRKNDVLDCHRYAATAYLWLAFGSSSPSRTNLYPARLCPAADESCPLRSLSYSAYANEPPAYQRGFRYHREDRDAYYQSHSEWRAKSFGTGCSARSTLKEQRGDHSPFPAWQLSPGTFV